MVRIAVSSLTLAMVIGAPCQVLSSLKRVSGREWTPDEALRSSPGTSANDRGSGPAVDNTDGSDPCVGGTVVGQDDAGFGIPSRKEPMDLQLMTVDEVAAKLAVGKT